jgi:hypothetical protein
VLTLANELELTKSQLEQVTAIYDRMNAAAKLLGGELITRSSCALTLCVAIIATDSHYRWTMGMSGGGSRPGERRGGRQKGSLNKRTRELLAPVTDAADISPKEVMLQAMRLHWAAGNVVDAVDCAAKAAPYVHPRLVAAAVARLPSEMSDEELAASIDDAEQAAAALARREKPSGAGGTRH